MIPTRRLLVVALGWMFPAVLAVIWPAWLPVWKWLGWVAGGLVLIDMVWLRMQQPPLLRRRLPGRFALGEPGEVMLGLTNRSRLTARVEVFDGIPAHGVSETMPWSGVLPPEREVRVFYPVKILERGEVVFGPVQVRRVSPLGLWMRQTRHAGDETVKVYPNYEPVVRFALLAMQHRDNPLGIVRRPRQ